MGNEFLCLILPQHRLTIRVVRSIGTNERIFHVMPDSFYHTFSGFFLVLEVMVSVVVVVVVVEASAKAVVKTSSAPVGEADNEASREELLHSRNQCLQALLHPLLQEKELWQ